MPSICPVEKAMTTYCCDEPWVSWTTVEWVSNDFKTDAARNLEAADASGD